MNPINTLYSKHTIYLAQFQNIFPLENSFSKGKMLGAGRPPSGTDLGEFTHLWLVFGSVIICHKPHVWEKSVGRDIWAQSGQSRLFLAFFSVFRI